MRYIIILLFSLGMASCRSVEDERLELVLEYAGTNRGELEQVLEAYSLDEADSLKLKAARFLISNMPGHYSMDSPAMRKFRAGMDSLYPTMSNVVRRVAYNIPFRKGVTNGWTVEEDVRVVSAAYLKGHIDRAIDAWNRCSWLRMFTFEEFCEYVLPYRIDREPLMQPDSTAYLWAWMNEMLEDYQYEPKTIMEFKELQRDLLGQTDNMYFKQLRTPGLAQGTYSFDCLDRCYYELSRYRSLAMPCAVDMVPAWPYRNGRHYWPVLMEPFYRTGNQGERLISETAKVYRMMYSHQPIPEAEAGEWIPPFFQTPFLKDVTAEYVKVSDVEVDVDNLHDEAHAFVYLTVFNDLTWKPVAWAKVERGEAVFRDMGRNIVYLPVEYDGRGNLQHVGYPFLLDLWGRTHAFVPDKEQTMTMRLTRKFPVNDAKIVWSESIKGARIEASNRPDFVDADTVYAFTETNPDMNYRTWTLERPATYRYWRIIEENQYIRIGEWQLLDAEDVRIQGMALPPKPEEGTTARAFDGDMLTYTEAYHWIGIDLGKPMEVASMKLVTRTDANGIEPGHYYELSYFDRNGWTVAGSKVATDDRIEFEQVPVGALFWLRDLTAGKEERIFTYKDGKVNYW